MARLRRTLPFVVIAACAATAAFAMVLLPQPTSAAWQDLKTLGATATAVTPSPPATFTCPGSGVLSSVPLTWTAPVGAVPSGYTLTWTGATSGTFSGTGLTHSVPASLLGNTTVVITADYGDWHSSGTSRLIRGLLTLWSCG